MQEGMGTFLKDTVIGHLKGEDDHLVLTKEKEEALTMAEVLVLLLHIERKGQALIMAEGAAQVHTKNQGVAVLSTVAAAEAMRALAGETESLAPSTVAVPTTRERALITARLRRKVREMEGGKLIVQMKGGRGRGLALRMAKLKALAL